MPLNRSNKDQSRVESLRQLTDFDHAFDRSFSQLAFIANRYLIDHMLRVGRLITENDYEAIVIWGVLAHQNIAHLMPPGSLPAAILNEKGRLDSDVDLRPLRLRDVAAITGIPRETVRRKLENLAEKKYVKRTEKGWSVIGDKFEPELRDFSRETILRLVAVSDDVLNALHHVDRKTPTNK